MANPLQLTKKECIEIAKQYIYRKEFEKNNKKIYDYVRHKKWLDDVCKHMLYKYHLPYTKKECIEIAQTYKSRFEFQKKSSGAYNKARNMGWLDEICEHMTPHGHKYKRGVYCYEIKKNEKQYIYIGLTHNFELRHKQHTLHCTDLKKNYTGIDKFCKENNLILPNMKILIDYCNYKIAMNVEKNMIKKFQNKGFHILNQVNGGCLGGSFKQWTFDMCQNYALECVTKNEFRLKYPNACNAAYKYGWIKLFENNWKEGRKTYTKEECAVIAKQYTYRKEFQKNDFKYFSAAYNNNWLEEICQHMIKRKNQYA